MKLCLVATMDTPHTHRWARWFASRGHEVHVISAVPSTVGPLPGVTVHFLPRLRTGVHLLDVALNGVLLPVRVARFRKVLRGIGPDVVHAHYVDDSALSALLAGFRPFVVTAWGSDVLIGPKRSRVLRRAVSHVLRRADLITCDAEHMRDAMVSLGADPRRIHIVFFGTDVERFQPRPRDEELESRLGLAGRPVIVSVRRLEPIYDIPTLVRALPLVLRRFPRAVLLIGSHGSEEPALRRLAADLGVDGSVRFVGSVGEADVPRYMSLADVYVSTSLSDAGLAASTAEAMACGLPAVVTDVCDNAKWVEHGRTGYLFPPRDAEALAERIACALADRPASREVGARGRERIVERNNWAREMERMDALYAGLAGGARAS
ncbi:MAG: glycosyltransferase [Planctomycetes bacterium]|nr:glycosyltransferase [Planctomycetota bacterium]